MVLYYATREELEEGKIKLGTVLSEGNYKIAILNFISYKKLADILENTKYGFSGKIGLVRNYVKGSKEGIANSMVLTKWVSLEDLVDMCLDNNGSGYFDELADDRWKCFYLSYNYRKENLNIPNKLFFIDEDRERALKVLIATFRSTCNIYEEECKIFHDWIIAEKFEGIQIDEMYSVLKWYTIQAFLSGNTETYKILKNVFFNNMPMWFKVRLQGYLKELDMLENLIVDYER